MSPDHDPLGRAFRVDDAGEAVVLTLRGDHDARTVSLLRAQIHEHVASGRPLVMDLSEMTFVDSMTLNAIAHADRLLQNAGRRLVLYYGESPPVKRAFELLGLVAYIPSADSRRAAVDRALHAVQAH